MCFGLYVLFLCILPGSLGFLVTPEKDFIETPAPDWRYSDIPLPRHSSSTKRNFGDGTSMATREDDTLRKGSLLRILREILRTEAKQSPASIGRTGGNLLESNSIEGSDDFNVISRPTDVPYGSGDGRMELESNEIGTLQKLTEVVDELSNRRNKNRHKGNKDASWLVPCQFEDQSFCLNQGSCFSLASMRKSVLFCR